MARIVGSKNIVRFEDRKIVKTTAKAAALHISTEDIVPREQFKDMLANHNNFLGWLKNMRDQLVEFKSSRRMR